MNRSQRFSIALGLFSLLLSSCAGVSNSTGTTESITPPQALKTPWKHMKKCCHVDPGAVTVVCPAEDFRKAMKSCTTIWERKGRCESRLVAAIKLGLVDKQMLEAQVYEMQVKLDSPWRSPYLWGIIGLCVGGVLGVGLSLGLGK